jgi:hypothetical protein
MDLDVVMRSNDCPYIVQFYGALFKEVSTFNTRLLHVLMLNNIVVNISIMKKKFEQ